jgi:hypothetical protein
MTARNAHRLAQLGAIALCLGTAPDFSLGAPVRSEEPDSTGSPVRVSGKGVLWFAGNEIPAPWTLSMHQGSLCVNGLIVAPSPKIAPSQAQLKEFAFGRQSFALADSLSRAERDVAKATRILRRFCESNASAGVTSTLGRVEVILPSGAAMELRVRQEYYGLPEETPARRQLVEQHLAHHSEIMAAHELRRMASFLEKGCGLVVERVGIYRIVPASEVAAVRGAIQGSGDSTAIKRFHFLRRQLPPKQLIRADVTSLGTATKRRKGSNAAR